MKILENRVFQEILFSYIFKTLFNNRKMLIFIILSHFYKKYAGGVIH